MSHTFVYCLVFMGNMTDYVFIQYQMLNILRLFVKINDFSSIFIICIICIAFHSTMLVNHNLRFLINKVFSWIVFISVILMVISCSVGTESQKKIIAGAKKTWEEDPFFSFDRGRVLQSLVLLVAAFRSNDEILAIFDQTGKKQEVEMKKYMIGSVSVFTSVSMIFGTVFYLRNFEQFRSTGISLENGFYGYYDNTILINGVRIIIQLRVPNKHSLWC